MSNLEDETLHQEYLISRYVKTPTQVAGLRQICVKWQKEFGFWSFDELLPILARSGSVVFFATSLSSEADLNPRWEAALLVDIGPFEADVLYVYVQPEARRARLAEKMFSALIEHLKPNPSIEAIFLEVRLSNSPAIALYEKLAMTRQLVRKKYYSNGEDALVFKLAIPR